MKKTATYSNQTSRRSSNPTPTKTTSPIPTKSSGESSSQTISKINRAVIESVSSECAALNLSFFVKRFKNLEFPYVDELKVSNSPVSLALTRWSTSSTEPTSATL